MRLLIRTEASPAIGLGHFMRCFAIAEEARTQGIAVSFLLNEVADSIATRLASIGAQAVTVRNEIGSETDLAVADLTRNDWLIIDSYKANSDYIRALTKTARVAVIDDLNALPRYDCDLLINTAQAACDMGYAQKTGARCLLGADYALIRREFLHAPKVAPQGPILTVMFGGSDPTQMTGQIARLVHDALPGVAIRLVAGPANVHTDELTALSQTLDRIHVFNSPVSVAQVLAGSDLVITAAGGSVGEVAAMGLPALVLVAFDNQAAALKACPFPAIDARNGLPDGFSAQVRALLDDAPHRAEIARSAHEIVDGKGALRIIEAMKAETKHV